MIVVGTIVRMIIAATTLGTNDSETWWYLGNHIGQVGLLESYPGEYRMNHPPIPVLYAMVIAKVGNPRVFLFFMKLPAILADAASALLVAWIWSRRGDRNRSMLAAAAIAFSPIAILISGYHCNTDNIYGLFSLLAFFCIQEFGNFLLAGLCLGAAINVKLIPILLLPAIYSFCHNWRDFRRLTLGLAITAIPFIPLLFVLQAVRENMINYLPPISRWGIPYFFAEAQSVERFHDFAKSMVEFYPSAGKQLILLVAGLIALVSWLKRDWTAYEIGLAVLLVFLVLAPGFSVQHLTMILPLFAAVSISRTWLFSITGGLFLFLIYWAWQLPGQSAPYTQFWNGDFPMPAPLFGILAWGVLASMLGKLASKVKLPIEIPLLGKA